MKPKMQLSDDVLVDPTFRQEMNKWMVDFFGYEDEPIETPTVLNDSNLIVRKRRKASSTKSLGDLLENIEKTFKNLEFDIDDVSFYRMLKSEVVGLKKCSPLITDTGFLDNEDWKETVDPKKGLPAYFVVAVNQGDKETKDTLAPDFAFGMRIKKAPWNVTKLQGTVYLFGMAWRDGKKHIWQGFWLSVLPNGEIQVAHELVNKFVNIPSGGYYTRRNWEVSAWHGPSDRVQSIRHCFCETLNRYQERNDHWNISVSNGKKRIIFLIPDNEAKSYFKSREKVVTVKGKTKPIIHFVRAYTQRHGDKVIEVPENIRGLREFDWSGYHCSITAPRFHAYSSSAFDVDGELGPDDVLPAGLLDIGSLADRMNYLESQGQVNKKRRK
jgi:hypothetical protein